jgi:hypothetical protein
MKKFQKDNSARYGKRYEKSFHISLEESEIEITGKSLAMI